MSITCRRLSKTNKQILVGADTETSITHLFGSFCEFLDAKLFVEVSSDEKEVDSGSEPDEGVRDANNHNLLVLFVSPPLRVLTNIAHSRRYGGESSGLIR